MALRQTGNRWGFNHLNSLTGSAEMPETVMLPLKETKGHMQLKVS